MAKHLLDSTEQLWHSFHAYAGGLLDLLSMFHLRFLCTSIGVSSINSHVMLDTDLRNIYLFNDTLSSVLNSCSILFLIATNIRKEAPILNIRVSNNIVNRQSISIVLYIGTRVYLRHNVFHIGISNISMHK